jgi:hypothetical protein
MRAALVDRLNGLTRQGSKASTHQQGAWVDPDARPVACESLPSAGGGCLSAPVFGNLGVISARLAYHPHAGIGKVLAPLAGYQQHWQHWLDVEGGEVFIHCPTPDLTPEAWNLGKTLPSIRCTVAAAAIWRYGDMKRGEEGKGSSLESLDGSRLIS